MSKSDIIANIKTNKPEQTQLPEIPSFDNATDDLLARFVINAEAVGSTVAFLQEGETINQSLKRLFPDMHSIASCISEIDSNFLNKKTTSPNKLQGIDLAIINCKFGVAENGAVWVTEDNLSHRILPFISEHLAIVLEQTEIVANMHHAYHRIKMHQTGFGVFIAGPSKTADIEQSLVIGAQGARTNTIILI